MNRLEQRLREHQPLWGGWYLSHRLFSGANSSVFLLRRDRQGQPLYSAMKVVELPLRDDSDVEQRLSEALAEIRCMEKLSDCPWIVSLNDDMVLSDGEGGYDVCMRMEYLRCLETMMREEELPWQQEMAAQRDAQIVRLAEDLCRALSCAHQQGILHRDIKPANIYKSDKNIWKLGDFSASRTLRFGSFPATVTGTTAYMAPEIGKGEAWGSWSDIYGLGIVLYQLLNDGFLPLTDETSTYGQREQAIVRRWSGEVLPPPAGGSPQLQAIVVKACHRQPQKRYADAEEMLEALQQLSKAPDPAQQSATGNRLPFCCRLRRQAAVLCVLLCTAALSFFVGRHSAGPQEPSTGPAAAQDGHRYEVILRKSTWEAAKIYCEAQGGHLATITSREEEELIVKLLDETDITIAWLGADNYNSSGGFRWITGEEFEYASWGIGEPNNTNGNEHCLMLEKRERQGWVWNDAPENGHDFYQLEEIGFICEWE